jgi:ligand-binding sensor domain-containing protein/signal transduction histidine kinase
MNFRSIIVSIILSVVATSGSLFSQETEIRFKRITINDGLSLSSVYCIYQDSKGFMWFGTEDGLNRYDGKNFVIYRDNPLDSNSISNKWIELIYEDYNNNLWFGSKGGLTRFNPVKEYFTQYRYSEDNINGLYNDTITSLLEDTKHNLWIGTLSGLNRIDLKNNTIGRYSSDFDGLQSRINFLKMDINACIWIGTNKGLFFWDSETDLISKIDLPQVDGDVQVLALTFLKNEAYIGTNYGLIRFNPNSGKSEWYYIRRIRSTRYADQLIENLHPTAEGKIWVVTKHGLFVFNPRNNTFMREIKSLDISHSLAINTKKPFIEDSKNNVWYGTYGDGAFKIDQENNHAFNYQHNPANPQSLSENSINCIYEDRTGVIWFGTFGAGISSYDPYSHKFECIKNNPLNQNSLSSNFIWTVIESSNGLVWIGTNDKGLNVYNPVNNRFSFYTPSNQDPYSISYHSIRDIFEDSHNNIWLGTDGGGLNKYLGNGKFKAYKSVFGDSTSLSHNSVRVIYEDKDGYLWIGTRQGLNRFDPSTEKFVQYLHDDDIPNSLSNNFIYSVIYQDDAENLWIGTYGGGLNKLNIKEERFTHYRFNPEDSNSISNDIVFTIHEDKDQNLWIGTNSGLNRFDRKSGKFTRFGKEEGLPNEVIYGILPDENNNIWLSTNLGIASFNLDDYSVRSYDVSDGLQSNEFNGGAFHKGSSNKLYFAGVYGLNIIEPDKIPIAENNAQVVFTKLEVLGKDVKTADLNYTWNREISPSKIVPYNKGFIASKSIAYLDEIILEYSHRLFSVQFAALNTPNLNKIEYAYMMKHLDEDWNYSGNRNYVSYTNMQPGEYVFMVKAKNQEDRWSETNELTIKITPPFWKTWWFILLEIIIIIGIIVFNFQYFLKVRTNRLLRNQNQTIKLANEKLTESERNLKELNATKDKFFSIISHDLKNPFSSLYSLSELVVENFETSDEKSRQDMLKRIQDMVKHIYDLLENLLTWTRSQRGRIEFNPVEFNLANLIEINTNLHRIPAEKKKIKLKNKAENEVKVYADRDMINTVVRNLINNAVKFTPSDKSIFVSIEDNTQYCKVLVKDEGVGIATEDQEKLFCIDQKLKTIGTEGEKGTGLGLILCKEFVEKNGGEIKVTSQPGKGSTFSFTIPKK